MSSLRGETKVNIASDWLHKIETKFYAQTAKPDGSAQQEATASDTSGSSGTVFGENEKVEKSKTQKKRNSKAPKKTIDKGRGRAARKKPPTKAIKKPKSKTEKETNDGDAKSATQEASAAEVQVDDFLVRVGTLATKCCGGDSYGYIVTSIRDNRSAALFCNESLVRSHVSSRLQIHPSSAPSAWWIATHH